jgi:F-type H+-transporting ATPase subunit epsilon
MPLAVELVSPESVAYSSVKSEEDGNAKMVVCRTTTGDIAFQTGHVPFIGVLATHPVRIYLENGTTRQIAVHQGFVEVSPAVDGLTKVTILSNVCEMADEIDVARATEARDRAQAALAADADDAKAKDDLARALVRLEVAGSN